MALYDIQSIACVLRLELGRDAIPEETTKCQFDYRKVRYRGIAKSGAQVFALLGLGNLYLVPARLAFAA